MSNRKRILVCPLDWGLGHAARCVPLIRELISLGNEVIIGADKAPLAFLREEFPDLEFIQFKGFKIEYPSRGGLFFYAFNIVPGFIYSIFKEHFLLQQVIKKFNIDAVISDNRYGLWSRKIKSIFICHQIKVKAPFGEGILLKINRYFLRKYDECWIPDLEGAENYSGELSHNIALGTNTKFIGPLTRFEGIKDREYLLSDRLLVIISGPEPHRSVFFEEILKELLTNKMEADIICGLPEKYSYTEHLGIKIYNHLKTDQLSLLIANSMAVVCRSGYSSIMDLSHFSKKVIFVPTPGQTEQEYLATYFKGKKQAIVRPQGGIDLVTAVSELNQVQPLPCCKKNDLKKHLSVFSASLGMPTR